LTGGPERGPCKTLSYSRRFWEKQVILSQREYLEKCGRKHCSRMSFINLLILAFQPLVRETPVEHAPPDGLPHPDSPA